MKHSFLLVLLLITAQARAQQLYGTKIPVWENERYVSYPRTKANALLFDSTQQYGFYNLLQQTVATAARVSNFDLRGIAPEERALLATCGTRLEWKLGEQQTVPLSGVNGGDSVIYLPDGTTEYVYPVRDTVFYSAIGYDEVVVREQLHTDNAGKKTYVPVELFLRKKSCVSGKPVVLLSLNTDALYELPKDVAVPVSAADNQQLLAALEKHLALAEKRFGADGLYQLSHQRYSHRTHMRRSLLPGGTNARYETPAAEIMRNPAAQHGDVGFRFVADTLKQYDESGEEVVYLDPLTGEVAIGFDVGVDTAWFVRKGFETVYEYRILQHQPDGTWKDHLSMLCATKTLIAGEVPHVAFEASVTDEQDNQWNSRPVSSYLKHAYALANNPFYPYMKEKELRVLPRLPWEDALFGHTLSFRVLPESVR